MLEDVKKIRQRLGYNTESDETDIPEQIEDENILPAVKLLRLKMGYDQLPGGGGGVTGAKSGISPFSFGDKLEKKIGEINPDLDKISGQVNDLGSGAYNLLKKVGTDVGSTALKSLKYTTPFGSLLDQAKPEILNTPINYLEQKGQEAIEASPGLEKPIAPIYEKIRDYVKKNTDLGESKGDDILSEVGKRGVKFIEGLETPENLAYLAGLGPLSKVGNVGKIASSAATAGFVPKMIEGTLQGGQEAYQGVKEGDYPKAAGGLTDAALNALMTYGLGKGIVEQPKAIETAKEVGSITPPKPLREVSVLETSRDANPTRFQIPEKALSLIEAEKAAELKKKLDARTRSFSTEVENKYIPLKVETPGGATTVVRKTLNKIETPETKGDVYLPTTAEQYLNSIIEKQNVDNRPMQESAPTKVIDPEVLKKRALEQSLVDKQKKINSGRYSGRSEDINDLNNQALKNGYVIEKTIDGKIRIKDFDGKKIISRSEGKYSDKVENPILIENLTPEQKNLTNTVIEQLGDSLDIPGMTKQQKLSAIKDIKEDGGKEASIRAQEYLKSIIEAEKSGTIGAKKVYGKGMSEPVGVPIKDLFKKEEPLEDISFDFGKNVEEAHIQDIFDKYFGNEIGAIGDISSLRRKKTFSEEYVKKLTDEQKKARQSEDQNYKQKIGSVYKTIKKTMVDSTAPIEDAIRKAEKEHGFKVLPSEDITNQIDRVFRSNSIADQFFKDRGMEDVIKKAPDLKMLDQYLLARHNKTLVAKGINEGRDLVSDQKLLDEQSSIYEEPAKLVTKYSRDLLDYSVESGLISKELANHLKTIYPDYVPMQSIFNELEKRTNNFGAGGVASLGKQSVVQKIKGSLRAKESPIASLLEKTYTAFRQGEKNKAARIITGYKDLPGMNELIKEVKPGDKPAHSISVLENGKKKIYETTKEIEAAAKSLDVEQINALMKALSAPTRIARIGITGMNPAFIAANVVKDQATAFLNSENGLRISLNPKLFVESLFNVVTHNKEYQEMIAQGGYGTSFDIGKGSHLKTVERIRSGRNLKSKIKYTITHPTELINYIENVIGRGEELTRMQQYSGTKKILLKEGRPIKDAKILAAKAARENTANFYRGGEWKRPVNALFLYFNAGIQGSRSIVKSMARSPLETSAKITTGLLMPVALLSLWNMSDPKRKAVYSDIEDYEKDGNLIYVPDNPKKVDGKWNIIKVPMPQGYNSLTVPVRKMIEQQYDVDKVKFLDLANSLVGYVSPFEIDKGKMLSTFTPQAIRPTLETQSNYDFFKGKPIVNKGMSNLPKEKQVYPWTSGTARKIGKLTDSSPLNVEHFIKQTFGGLGTQGLNLADQLLSKFKVIKPDQIGGQSPIEAIESRFSGSYGGRKKRLKYEKENKK